jgi:hypothetical protein
LTPIFQWGSSIATYLVIWPFLGAILSFLLFLTTLIAKITLNKEVKNIPNVLRAIVIINLNKGIAKLMQIES